MKKPTLHTWRRTIQIGVANAFIIIPWLNHMQISIVYGNFLSFHFYKFPLADPLAVLQVTLKNSYFCADLLIGAGIGLLIAACLGTVFCSWICPFGLLSEWGYALSKRWKPKNHLKETHPRRKGFRTRIVFFLIGISGFFLFTTTPVLNQLSLPAWYSRIFQFWFEQRHLSMAILSLAVIIAVEVATGTRLWCRSVCPQSVLISLAKLLNKRRLQVDFNTDECICNNQTGAACLRACSLGLDPKRLNHWLETECTNCGDCISVCKNRGGALTFRWI